MKRDRPDVTIFLLGAVLLLIVLMSAVLYCGELQKPVLPERGYIVTMTYKRTNEKNPDQAPIILTCFGLFLPDHQAFIGATSAIGEIGLMGRVFQEENGLDGWLDLRITRNDGSRAQLEVLRGRGWVEDTDVRVVNGKVAKNNELTGEVEEAFIRIHHQKHVYDYDGNPRGMKSADRDRVEKEYEAKKKEADPGK